MRNDISIENTSSFDRDKNKTVFGNDWRVLEPVQIGDGDFSDPVTVVLPCYMGQKELALTFASLANQTYPHDLLEVIVVDDGSDPPIKIPFELPFETSVVSQERDGFGLARARNLGAEKAKGEILIFLDCDMIPESQLIEAHARWHRINNFSLTLGFRYHADFSDISSDDLSTAAEPRSLLEGKRVTSPQWIEFHMRRTKDLTSDDSDLFRIATGGNLGVRKSFFKEIGGFDASFKQWGGEDIEFGFRAFNSGAILIPERLATAWHQGEGASPDPNEEISLAQQRHRLSHLIAEKTFRQSSPGRSFQVPLITVQIDSEDQTFDEVSSQINSILSSNFHDLVVVLKISDNHNEKVSLERQYGLDPRVQISENALEEIPNAAFRLELPRGVCLTAGAIDYLIKSVDEFGVSQVVLEKFGEIRIARTRALKRSLKTNKENFWDEAKILFKENVIKQEDFLPYVANAKNFAPQTAMVNPSIWTLAGKVAKKFLRIKNPHDFIRFIGWVIRGFVNVYRRAKRSRGSKRFVSHKGYSSLQNQTADWLRLLGDSSLFPNIKKWSGEKNGVEVVVVDPTIVGEKDINIGISSVVLGETMGVPLCPPFDEREFNPIGFSPVRKDAGIGKFSNHKTSIDRIRYARQYLALEVEKIDSPNKARETVEYLAAGVPVLLKDKSGADRWFGKELVELLDTVKPEDLKDETTREHLSVHLRRTALHSHSFNARLRQVRTVAGLITPQEPLISVVVATKRPEMVNRIIEIVAHQDYPNLELILALHGDSFREGSVSTSEKKLDKTVLHYPEEIVFGQVLSEASNLANGEWVAKMDDDDWYGSEHISDLLLAARYSGADLVGKGSEFVYLEEKDLTIRRSIGNNETVSRTLAGGTLLFRSELLRAINGWRYLPRGVDVALIDDAVAAGASLWRTHPFGYLLRRTSGEHTWGAKDSYFIRNADQEWDGKKFDIAGVMK